MIGAYSDKGCPFQRFPHALQIPPIRMCSQEETVAVYRVPYNSQPGELCYMSVLREWQAMQSSTSLVELLWHSLRGLLTLSEYFLHLHYRGYHGTWERQISIPTWKATWFMNTNLVRCCLVNADVLLPHSGCCWRALSSVFFNLHIGSLCLVFSQSGCAFRSIQNILVSAASKGMPGQWIRAQNKANNDPLFLFSSYWLSIKRGVCVVGDWQFVWLISSCPYSTIHNSVSVCAEACACTCTDGGAMGCKAILHCAMTSYVIDLSRLLFHQTHLPGWYLFQLYFPLLWSSWAL